MGVHSIPIVDIPSIGYHCFLLLKTLPIDVTRLLQLISETRLYYATLNIDVHLSKGIITLVTHLTLASTCGNLLQWKMLHFM